jgi:hypothetical protein
MMVLRKNYRRRKGNSTAKLVIWLAALLIIGFGLRWYYLSEHRFSIGQKASTTPSSSLATASAAAGWPKLRDRYGVYEFGYPRSVFKYAEKNVLIPPEDNDKSKAQVLSHSIPAKHCVGGECSATTTDMSVSFLVVGRSFGDVFRELKEKYGDLPVVTVDGHQGVRFEQGSGAEGRIYLVLPVDDAKTLFIGRSYINEKVATSYGSAKNFIPLAEQKAIFDQIMSTFRFRPSF